MTVPASLPSGLTVRRYAPAPAAVVVELTGTVDIRTEAAMRAALVLPDSGVRLLVCDLTPLSFMGACGLQVLLQTRDALIDQGAGLRVVVTRPVIVRMMAVTGLTEVLGVRATVAEALGEGRA
ncbi:anti-sigma factor antagonist [Hamadaea tsunoensis]|uniref:anti-sigma factor antagonist n=1 Tax=Hamadaea tsunoensis TaxID=53368 RepID=UPI0012F950D2|nr:anti-sigma factor antagonist [Hamadaea tsunoensis]